MMMTTAYAMYSTAVGIAHVRTVTMTVVQGDAVVWLSFIAWNCGMFCI